MTFEEWLGAHLPSLLRLATVLSGSPAVAEDLVQDVLVRVHARWPQIQGLEHPTAYVRRMVVNEHLSWRRRVKCSLGQLSHTDETIAAPGAAFDDRMVDQAELIAEIGRLPARQRAVVVLRFFEDLTVAEAAQTLGCTESTVRAYSSRALSRLRVGLTPTSDRRPSADRTPLGRIPSDKKEDHAH